ncbi:MAG TPA: DNA mismatch endonuclease Vsr [Candidatus Cloacimonadota bacterium]|nr:DNA mismatch endonuclease Vsr [Candidatus Cloacimonadota bacterium]
MVDRISEEQRSWNMSRIKSKNTKPEMVVRSLLHKMGFRFRLHVKDLPGKPDIVLPKYKTVIFVNGCFWHQHEGCKRATIPKSNQEYWLTKLDMNVQKDQQIQVALIEMKWKIMIVWECELKRLDEIMEKLSGIKS